MLKNADMKSLKFKDFQIAARSLGQWFERTSRVLPWRETPSPYRVWISEIMLQQTQVVTVVPYFERFLARFPTVESLAQASEDDVLLNWAGLGYYSRARNVHATAKQVAATGGFPASREAWLELPGVGPYTAGAISSIAYDQVEPILDGNVERVISRVKALDRSRGDSAYKGHLWKLSGLSVQMAAEVEVRPRQKIQNVEFARLLISAGLMQPGRYPTFLHPRRPRSGSMCGSKWSRSSARTASKCCYESAP
jgi:adenine-specific DNA glycosylase